MVKGFDLEERTARFGEAIITFVKKKIPEATATKPIITQLVKSGTSVGANYCEATDSESKKDFIHKMGICRKESKETMYWLRMVALSAPALAADARLLWKEANELNLICSASIRTARKEKK